MLDSRWELIATFTYIRLSRMLYFIYNLDSAIARWPLGGTIAIFLIILTIEKTILCSAFNRIVSCMPAVVMDAAWRELCVLQWNLIKIILFSQSYFILLSSGQWGDWARIFCNWAISSLYLHHILVAHNEEKQLLISHSVVSVFFTSIVSATQIIWW